MATIKLVIIATLFSISAYGGQSVNKQNSPQGQATKKNKTVQVPVLAEKEFKLRALCRKGFQEIKCATVEGAKRSHFCWKGKITGNKSDKICKTANLRNKVKDLNKVAKRKTGKHASKLNMKKVPGASKQPATTNENPAAAADDEAKD